MSAIPLPALPVTPAPAPTPSPAPTSSSQSGSSAFNAHLQSVQQQQQQQQQSASEAQDASQQAAARQNSNQTSSHTQGKASAKPGDDASNDNAQSSDASDDSSMPTGIVSLANTVLNLIDQATGDTGKGKTASANAGKPANAKPTTQGNDQPQSGAAQALGLVAPLPPPVVPAASAAGKGDDNAANSNGVAALQGNGKNLQSSLAASMQKGANDVDDSDDDGDAKAVGATGDSTASAQTADDNTQVFASALSAVSHAAAGQGDTTASASSSNSTPDLASLHGVADAAAVVTPPVTPAAGTHTLSVNAPVGSSGFAKELGHQVTWLSGQEIKQAQIKLNPQDLGPLDVKVSIEHGRVDVAFMTQHAATATAVQQGLDQLHQMLGGQGLSLGHTSVGQHASQQQFADQQRQSSGASTSGDDGDQAGGSSAGETLKRVAIGLVDAFA